MFLLSVRGDLNTQFLVTKGLSNPHTFVKRIVNLMDLDKQLNSGCLPTLSQFRKFATLLAFERFLMK